MGKRARKDRERLQRQQEDLVDDILNEEDQHRRQKKILNHNFKLDSIKPLTENQKKVFISYGEGKNILLCGSAGTGKTFLALYFALGDLFVGNARQIVIVRSAVSSRDQGFMPGNLAEKMAVYELPYKDIVAELTGGRRDIYDTLKKKCYLEFMSTSYIRGLTFDDAVIILDEAQNMTDHEINSVLTRVGKNSRIIICGDFRQDDLKMTGKKNHETGMKNMLKIAESMSCFDLIEFNINDIVRSGFVRDYIIARMNLNLD